MAQYTIQLQCTKDTYTDSDSPSSNYASSTSLLINYSPAKFGFMGFSLSEIPEKKRILSATLKAYMTASSEDSSPVIVHAISDDSDMAENVITWENDPYDITAIWKDNTNRYFATGTINAYANANILLTILQAYSLGLDKIWLRLRANVQESATIQSKEAANKPYLEIVYEDAPPNAPTPIDPVGAYRDSGSIIRFAWQYNSDVGGTQKKFDLEWSADQSTWTTVSQTTANNYYDMPADTFPAGNIYWRVQTYNEYDEASDYCDIQSFYAIGAPNTPAINAVPTNTARPTISWSAFSQQVYQLQVLSGDSVVYDSSVVPGINTRSHKIIEWLADGEYTVQMRIKNEYDMWSDWGAATVTISTVKPDKPTLTLQQSAHGVEISATGLVYRSEYDKDNFICIGTASGTYYDNTVASGKEYKYFVRAVSENDTFADSDIKFIRAEFRHALIAPVTDLTNVFVFSRSLNAPPKRTYNRQPGGAMVQYAGRTYPVWEPTEHISAGLSLSFFLKTWAEVETFMTIYDLNSTVLYRDAKGRKIYGTLSNLSIDDDILGYIIGFTINQTDYNEEV